MKKTISILLVVLSLILTLAACGTADKQTQSSKIPTNSDPIPDTVGGYTLDGIVSGKIPETQMRIFNEATENTDYNLFPLACIGSRVIAGSVNAYICVNDHDTANAKLVVAFITKMSGQNAVVTSTVDFKISDFNENASEPVEQGVYGAWTAITNGGIDAMPQELATAFNQAFEDLDGMSYVPLACVGTQSVAGTNYALICNGEATAPNAKANVYLIEINAPLQGKASLISSCRIDLSALENAEN